MYQYDATYQVTGVKYGVSNPQAGYAAASNAVRTVSYAYDAVGNRTSLNDSAGPSTTYAVNNLNQYTAVAGANYSYTARGDLAGDGTWTYGYDYEGHLISASKAGMNVQYTYDMKGRRSKKTVNGTITGYVYNGDNLLEERDGSGNVTASYVYAGGLDHPAAVTKGGSTYYFQQDALGNVTALTDSTGTVIEQYSYDVYGTPTIKDSSGNPKSTALTPFLFTGREYDQETGLYHYRTRAYSPALGRFLQPDCISFDGRDVNIHRYVENNPLIWTDPVGFYVTYGGDWTDEDAQNFNTAFNQEWNTTAGRDKWNQMYADCQEHQITPDGSSPPYKGGATKFTDSHVQDSLFDQLMGAMGMGGPPKPPKKFLPPTNPPQLPPTNLKPGQTVRVMGPNAIYPNGYWRLYEGNQALDPSTGAQPKGNITTEQFNAMTHVELPPP